MKANGDRSHLLDVVRAARLIVEFSSSTNLEDFQTNLLVQSAILHQFLVLGEAAKRLSSDLKARHPDLPWRQMAAMRDRVIHGYDVVKLDLVWNTIVRDIPVLLAKLELLLPERPDE